MFCKCPCPCHKVVAVEQLSCHPWYWILQYNFEDDKLTDKGSQMDVFVLFSYVRELIGAARKSNISDNCLMI